MNNATINAALADPACQRLAEWAAIGPVQRAAVESFADRIAQLAKPCEWTNCPTRVGNVCCNDRPA